MLWIIIRTMPPFKLQKAVLTRSGHQSSSFTKCCTQKRMLSNAMFPFTMSPFKLQKEWAPILRFHQVLHAE